VAAACETGLAGVPEEPIAVTLTRALASTSPDAMLLNRWLVDRETHTGLPVEPDLRWSAIHRLASLGEIEREQVDEERVADGTIVGVLGAARATAAIPTPEAKAAAWERLLGDGLSNREFEAVSHGFWDPEQTGLVHDYLPRYLHEGLAAARRRGPSFEERLGKSFPLVPFADEHVAVLAEVLRDDVPTVLRRAWEDAYDDLTRTR
jgi:aminopeptidase N